jgi:magnesium transporter
MEKMLRLRTNSQLQHLIKMYEEDEDLLEDVIIENKQAIEMVEMYSHILSSMMDAFASIISNNLNIVMKFLASMTILLAIPTMLSSFWGMNVGVPFMGSEFGFWFVITVSVIFTSIAAYGLWKKQLF